MKILFFEFIFVSVIGTLFHFTFKFFKCQKTAAIFSATNESTFEHIKIAVMPCYLFMLINSYFIKSNPNYYLANLSLIISIIILIPLLFYIPNIFKKTNAIYNILIFFVSIFVGICIANYILLSNSLNAEVFSKISLCIILILFVIFSFVPPHIFLFKDPITNKYGIINTCK